MQQAPAETGPGGSEEKAEGQDKKKDGEVIDAEFVDVDEEKK